MTRLTVQQVLVLEGVPEDAFDRERAQDAARRVNEVLAQVGIDYVVTVLGSGPGGCGFRAVGDHGFPPTPPLWSVVNLVGLVDALEGAGVETETVLPSLDRAAGIMRKLAAVYEAAPTGE